MGANSRFTSGWKIPYIIVRKEGDMFRHNCGAEGNASHQKTDSSGEEIVAEKGIEKGEEVFLSSGRCQEDGDGKTLCRYVTWGRYWQLSFMLRETLMREAVSELL